MTGDFATKYYFTTKLYNFDTIIENKADFFIIKNKAITFKNVKLK